MNQLAKSIGIFDSGLGGISVLAEAIKQLPYEHFLYLGDHLNVPYGDKQPGEVLRLTRLAVDKFLANRCKAIVIACNTATSAAVSTLREELSIPIIGMEPALKPASEILGDGDILVMATKMTLSQPKFQHLMERYGHHAKPVICSGLMEYVEAGEFSGPKITDCLKNILTPYMQEPVKAVVLGCTHYVFLRESIEQILGSQIPLIDGNYGTIVQLKRVLKNNNLLQPESEKPGSVSFLTTSNKQEETLKQMEKMLGTALHLGRLIQQ